jgi:CRP/FNR family transcriptional regulator, cyclic AMP receptor protein
MIDAKPDHKLPRETLDLLLSGIPFFKALKQQDQSQYEYLIKVSRVLAYEPGEVVLHKGDNDYWLFFLLKGKLAVYVGDPAKGELVNFITAGEVFGDIAQLLKQSRTATVLADKSARQSLVFALDFSVFGSLSSTVPISLQTKLIYYRNMVHNLRWKLEVYRSQHLQHALANKHRQIKLFTGLKDTQNELGSLHEQATGLALLLTEWNKEFGSLPVESLSASTSIHE